MASPVEEQTPVICDNAFCMVVELYDRGGAILLCLLFIAFVFYKLVWKVWSGAMASKDSEIERLINERNFYQKRFLPERLSSNDVSESHDD